MRVKLVKPFRYGMRIFEAGEVGEVVEAKTPLTFRGELVYDYYVKFDGFKPIGVLAEEVEVIDDKS